MHDQHKSVRLIGKVLHLVKNCVILQYKSKDMKKCQHLGTCSALMTVQGKLSRFDLGTLGFEEVILPRWNRFLKAVP